METIIQYIGFIGAFTLTISGSIKAMRKQFDPFGILIIAFITAVGGGTLRDILIEGKPIFWLIDTSYIYIILAGTIFSIIFRNKLYKLQKFLLLFDTIGLGLYTIIGVQVGIDNNLNAVICIILGTLTGSFGGVLRDILVNEIPVIFEKEIYASVSIVGGAFYLGMIKTGVELPYSQLIPILFIIALRTIIIKFNLSLPEIRLNRDK